MVRWQVVTAGESILDLHIPTVKLVMDMYGIHDQFRCLNLVLKTFHHFLKIDNDKRSQKLEQMKHGHR